MPRCDYLISNRDVVRGDYLTIPKGHKISRECLRLVEHHGPHLIKTWDGFYVTWEQDLCPIGECEDCDNRDSSGGCLAYREVSSAKVVQKYLEDPKFTGEE